MTLAGRSGPAAEQTQRSRSREADRRVHHRARRLAGAVEVQDPEAVGNGFRRSPRGGGGVGHVTGLVVHVVVVGGKGALGAEGERGSEGVGRGTRTPAGGGGALLARSGDQIGVGADGGREGEEGMSNGGVGGFGENSGESLRDSRALLPGEWYGGGSGRGGGGAGEGVGSGACPARATVAGLAIHRGPGGRISRGRRRLRRRVLHRSRSAQGTKRAPEREQNGLLSRCFIRRSGDRTNNWNSKTRTQPLHL